MEATKVNYINQSFYLQNSNINYFWFSKVVMVAMAEEAMGKVVMEEESMGKVVMEEESLGKVVMEDSSMDMEVRLTNVKIN